MGDIHSQKVRSYNMSRIRSKNTKPEMIVRKFLFSHGFRYRLHNKKLIGKPDIVLSKYKAAVFVHGCFWHGHENCKYFKLPSTRQEYWLPKIENNIQRDKDALTALRKLGWKVFTVWECELKKDKMAQTLTDLAENIKSQD